MIKDRWFVWLDERRNGVFKDSFKIDISSIMDQGGRYPYDRIEDKIQTLWVYSFTILFHERPQGIHECDEWGVPWILGQVCSSIFWCHIHLFSDEIRSWWTPKIGSTMCKRKQIVWETIKMFFLPIEDSLLGTCNIWWRYCCGSNKSRGDYGMANTEKCTTSA